MRGKSASSRCLLCTCAPIVSFFRCRGTGTGQSRPSRIGPGLFRRAELRAQGAHLPPCHEFGLFFFGIRPVSLRWFFEDPCPTLSPGSARKKAPPCGQTLSLAGILSCCVLSSRTPPRPPGRPQMAFHMFSGIVRIPGALPHAPVPKEHAQASCLLLRIHNAESQYLAQLRIYVPSVCEEKGPLLDMTLVDVDDILCGRSCPVL